MKANKLLSSSGIQKLYEGGDGGQTITEEEFNKLTQEEKDNGIAYFVSDGEAPGGSGGNSNSITLTQAEYDELVETGKIDADTTYFISDGNEIESSEIIHGNSNVGDEIDIMKLQLNGLSFVKCTQEEYDAMGEHLATTVYIIQG